MKETDKPVHLSEDELASQAWRNVAQRIFVEFDPSTKLITLAEKEDGLGSIQTDPGTYQEMLEKGLLE